MRLKNILIVVSDIEKAVAFYKNLFGLDVILNQDGNVMMTEGLVLQERAIWEKAIDREVLPKNHSMELYFVENDMDTFLEKLASYPESIEYVSEPETQVGGKRVVRIYDLDGNLIEVGTSC